jgi:hypothetical protein
MSYVKPSSVNRLEKELEELEKSLTTGVEPEDDQEDEEKEEQEVTTETVEDTTEEVVEEPVDKEEQTFKKRYADLRRHNQKVIEDLKTVKAELEAAKKNQTGSKLPSAEEAAKWAEKNPEAAAIIRAIANEQLTPSSQEVLEIKQKLQQAEEEARILKEHPDFREVVETDDFYDWVEKQSPVIEKMVYSTDPEDVIYALKVYKQEKTPKLDAKKEAAKAVSKSATSAPESKTKGRFSESQVQKMSMSEYEKNEPAILQSQRDGTFVYDLSGAAR